MFQASEASAYVCIIPPSIEKPKKSGSFRAFPSALNGFCPLSVSYGIGVSVYGVKACESLNTTTLYTILSVLVVSCLRCLVYIARFRFYDGCNIRIAFHIVLCVNVCVVYA